VPAMWRRLTANGMADGVGRAIRNSRLAGGKRVPRKGADMPNIVRDDIGATAEAGPVGLASTPIRIVGPSGWSSSEDDDLDGPANESLLYCVE
jgi:hypothetical protein